MTNNAHPSAELSAPPTPTLAPETKIAIIQASFRCLSSSLLALVPLAGIPWIFISWGRCFRMRIPARQQGFPSKRYVRAARWLAMLAVFLQIGVLGFMMFCLNGGLDDSFKVYSVSPG